MALPSGGSKVDPSQDLPGQASEVPVQDSSSFRPEDEETNWAKKVAIIISSNLLKCSSIALSSKPGNAESRTAAHFQNRRMILG